MYLILHVNHIDVQYDYVRNGGTQVSVTINSWILLMINLIPPPQIISQFIYLILYSCCGYVCNKHCTIICQLTMITLLYNNGRLMHQTL